MKPKRQRLVVAMNPTASFGRRREVGPTVVSALMAQGHEVVSLQEATFAQLGHEVHRAIADSPDALIVVGGDGMVNLGTNLVATTGIPLGIVPSGTGNDMARGLGIPHADSLAATSLLIRLLQGEPRTIDAGVIDFTDTETGERRSRWFAGMLSAGFDSIVNERANRLRFPKGASRYQVALLLELVRLSPIPYRLTLDGQSFDSRAMLVSVGNNVSLGGGMKVTPDALLDDGLFDVLVVQPLGRLQFLRIFPRVFNGTHLTDSRVDIHRARNIRIESDVAVIYADGERIARPPVDVTVVPSALKVFAPH